MNFPAREGARRKSAHFKEMRDVKILREYSKGGGAEILKSFSRSKEEGGVY
jgi:hypothetical protein